MPTGIPIQQLASQDFSITLDGNLYQISIKTCNGITTVSLEQNGTDIVDNAIAPSAGPIIPAQYLEAGNFAFLTANQQLPNYEQFGVTQSLVYFTEDELAAFRVPPNSYVAPLSPANPQTPTVTASFFNPIAALPLRFAPQGYTS